MLLAVGVGLGRGAARGECGESVESFFSRGRSAYVGFSCLLLLAPVRGGTSFLCKRAKKRSKETRFKPPTFKCRRCSLQVFGTNIVRLPQPQPAVEHQPFSQAALTRFAYTAPVPLPLATTPALTPSVTPSVTPMARARARPTENPVALGDLAPVPRIP